MTISTNYNPSALKVQKNLNNATNSMNRALEKMSTGFKVNRAADDAAGLYISTGLTTQIRGLSQAKLNTQDGISYINTATGALNNITNILNRLRDLAVQGANGIYSDEARTAMQSEADALTEQLYQIKNGTMFNGKNVFGEPETSPITTFASPPLTNDSFTAADSDEFIQAVTKMSEADAIAAGYTLIKTAADLDNIRNNSWGRYMLMNDIDLSTFANWDPIGDVSQSFSGVLDGNGYKISNMKIDRPSMSNVGLFGVVESATIENLGVENADIKGANSVGGLVGSSIFLSTIKNSYVTGVVSGKDNVGGVIADVTEAVIIENSYSAATVMGSGDNVGGLLGNSFVGTSIENSYASGSVTGKNNTGGLIGLCNGVSVMQSYASGNVKGLGDSTGGLIGCGLVSIVSNAYVTGNVSGTTRTGGLIGQSQAGTIDTSYAVGSVVGTTMTGGLVGENASSIYRSFWDIQKTGQVVGLGLNRTQPENTQVTGLTTDQMEDKNTFVNNGWDNTIWDFSSLPPKFQWQPKEPPIPPIPPTFTSFVRLQVGANSDSTSSISFDAGFVLGNFSVDYTSEETSRVAIDSIDEIINRISSKNSDFGAILNRLDSVLQSQSIQIENFTASRSTIMDADIAEESASFVKNQILQQTSASLLVQSQSLHKNSILALVQN